MVPGALELGNGCLPSACGVWSPVDGIMVGRIDLAFLEWQTRHLPRVPNLIPGVFHVSFLRLDDTASMTQQRSARLTQA